jgi:molybdate transport system substrate-binding protein
MQSGAASKAAGLALLVLLASRIAAEAAEVRVLSAVGMRQVMLELGPTFERATRHTLAISFDSSGVIVKRLAAGEAADVVLIARPALHRAFEGGRLVADSRRELARSRAGVAARKGAARPDISTVEAFKKTLLAARAIAYPDPTLEGSSGVHVAKVLERLGIADALRSRTLLASTPGDARATPGYLVATGKAELALHQIQELLAVPGIELLGPLPDELQETFVFEAAISRDAKNTSAAGALIEFLRSDAARAAIETKGMLPPAR